MKFVVLDASVSVKWYVTESDSEAAQGLLDLEFLFLVPDIFFVEVAGALLRQHREHHQISKTDVLLATEDLLQVGVEPVSSLTLLPRAVDISLALMHPIKDCFYLALAERWQTVLITADLRSEWAKYVIPLANADEIV